VHELSIVTGIIDAVREAIKDRDIEAVEEVVVEIGELMFLSPDQMRFVYEALTENTPLQGSRLTIVISRARISCEKCGYEGEITVEEDPLYHYVMPIFSCPECGGSVRITGGRDCYLREVRVRV
jgi:hydrogenase nickel incorporation protein HypA/HybF